MTFPTQIRAGDTLQWRTDEALTPLGDPIRSADGWALTTYVRFPVAAGATQATGATYGTGWESTVSAGLTSLFPAATRGSWQSVASKAGVEHTIGAGSFDVLASLSMAGAVDNRSQARRDLDSVQAAIRKITQGGGTQEITIGSQRKKRYSLTELIALESKLQGDVVREEAAQGIANGKGNPYNVFVRFG